MKFLILLLLAAIAWLITRLIYTVNSYRDDLADIKRQLAELKTEQAQLSSPSAVTDAVISTKPEAREDSPPRMAKMVSMVNTAKAEDNAAEPANSAEPVNINTASKTHLQSLPKIGAVTAQRIIEARPFSQAEDLLKVDGITPELLSRLKPQIEL